MLLRHIVSYICMLYLYEVILHSMKLFDLKLSFTAMAVAGQEPLLVFILHWNVSRLMALWIYF